MEGFSHVTDGHVQRQIYDEVQVKFSQITGYGSDPDSADKVYRSGSDHVYSSDGSDGFRI